MVATAPTSNATSATSVTTTTPAITLSRSWAWSPSRAPAWLPWTGTAVITSSQQATVNVGSEMRASLV
jgi:hypothetical protein